MGLAGTERDQRIVFVGLRRMTDDRSLIIDGFRHWNQTLAQVEFDAARIVNGLVEYLGLDTGQKKSLYVALHAAANRSTDELPRVPQVLIDRVASAQAPADSASGIDSAERSAVRPASPPHVAVTAALLQSLATQLGRQDAAASDELAAILIDEGLQGVTADLTEVFRRWAVGGLANAELPASMTEAECRSAFHALYLLLCEVVGPMDADALVERAVNVSRQLDEAARFAPAQLL